MKVVVVDDNAEMKELIVHAISDFNCEVVTFDNGRDALNYVENDPNVSIVITDLIMPIMDGLELTKSIRALERETYLHIIMVTGISDRESMVEAIVLGADDYVMKPIYIEEVHAKVAAALRMQDLQKELVDKNLVINKALKSMQEDLESAAKMAESLLPSPCVIENTEFASVFYPCSVLGGDLYGHRELDSNTIAFYQIDVAGHGVPSALLSFTLSYELARTGAGVDLLFNHEGVKGPRSVVDVVSDLNARYMLDSGSLLYFTMVYGVLNLANGRVSFCQAGHPPPIHDSASTGAVSFMGDGGFPVGMFEIADYEEVSFQLAPGDRFFLYSDGITEAMNLGGEQYGESRLAEAIGGSTNVSFKETVNEIHENLIDWTEGNPIDDDVTILAFQWNG
ncbi:hypothetical protein A9Q99_00365 [Gammaproteobacteria bacterium 45_16_T64]|nr:hypothetical protein A9Q99_00365 [Gammaproteobacteria bacterium 45_16_T64]